MTAPADVTVRTLETPDELAGLCGLIFDVFGDPSPNVVDMRGSLLAGGVCAGAFLDGEIVGGLWSFAGWDESGPFQHSHSLCVRPDLQGRRIGTMLKRFHADWCRDRSISRIVWTFDPLMVPNARLNLNRLGAVGDRWIVDCYGSMPGKLDPASRTGEDAPSDRLSVTWHIDGPRADTTEVTAFVPIPPTGGSAGAVPAEDAILRLRSELGSLIENGAIVTGVEQHDGAWSYRVAHGRQ